MWVFGFEENMHFSFEGKCDFSNDEKMSLWFLQENAVLKIWWKMCFVFFFVRKWDFADWQRKWNFVVLKENVIIWICRKNNYSGKIWFNGFTRNILFLNFGERSILWFWEVLNQNDSFV